MATFDYAAARTTAQNLLAKFGQTGAIRRLTPGGGPAHNPGQPTSTDHAATLVVLDYSERERDGTLIQAGDKKVIISTEGLAIEPAVSDKVVIASNAHDIVAVKPLNPGGTVLLWEVQVRA